MEFIIFTSTTFLMDILFIMITKIAKVSGKWEGNTKFYVKIIFLVQVWIEVIYLNSSLLSTIFISGCCHGRTKMSLSFWWWAEVECEREWDFYWFFVVPWLVDHEMTTVLWYLSLCSKYQFFNAPFNLNLLSLTCLFLLLVGTWLKSILLFLFKLPLFWEIFYE